MKKRNVYIIFAFSIIFILLAGILAFVEIQNNDKEYQQLFMRHTKIFSPEVPMKADFAGEKAPLDLFYIKEGFGREIMAGTFMHSSTNLMFKRAYRWFPVIEPILKKNNIPDDFKFIAAVESNFANVTSPSGAEGFWQFIKITGQKYGLEINAEVDERYNLEKATEAACKYFKDAYKVYKNWTLVAASYNRGVDGINKALEKQRVSSYYDLYLNDETSRYVFRILAFKEVYNHPTHYGFYLREKDFYPQIPCKLLPIDSSITSLPDFAIKMKVNYRILRELNPWIQGYTLPNKSKKIYVFLFPKEGGMSYENLLKKIPLRETFFHDTLKLNEVH